MEQYSELTRKKIRLYFAANYLFSQGKSHPQVVEILSQYEADVNLLIDITDAAMKDKWRTIFNESQRLIAEGKSYQQAIEAGNMLEKDPEIVRFICNTWYEVQVAYAENTVEYKTNIWEGVESTIICGLGTTAMLYFKASLLAKILWSLGLVASVIIWLYGLHQKKLSGRLKKIIEEDYMQYDKVI